MNEKIVNNHNRALEALREYSKSILEQFLSLAKSLSEEMRTLCEAGIDAKLYLRFEGVEVDEDEEILYTVVDREEVIKFREVLKSMDEENAINLFNEHFSKDSVVNIWAYEQFVDMRKLADASQKIKKAEKLIKLVEWQK